MNIYEKISVAICLIVLLRLSVEDIKSRKLNLLLIILLAFSVLSIRILSGQGLVESAYGVLPGMVAIVISIVTKGKMGMGDALLLTALGMKCGLKMTLELWFLSLTFCSFFGIVLLTLKKATRQTPLPFVPFLFLGYAVCEIVNVAV